MRHLRDSAIRFVLGLCAFLSVFTTVGIVAVLLFETWGFFQEVSIWEYLFSSQWTPLFSEKHFGIAPLLAGTIEVTAGAMFLALPIGLVSAIYLSEYAPEGARRVLKPFLELLAGIPTVVYGYFALLFISPILRGIFPDTSVFNAASASIVMGIMIIPMVSSLSEDAMTAVPRSLREAAYALGGTKMEVSLRVVVPSALSGIIAAFILAISRAIGETMIVAIAAGQQPRLTLNPLEAIQTMTAYIVQVSLGDTPTGTLEFRTIFAVAMTLFVLTLVLNVISQLVLRRFREAYR
ncbi:MAG: phosphate ABC transporter permease subunit PstC [Dehalococcoidia bacterium]|nr:phosphate ABC transporter permease subunit PstC [Dehalococcoidia bacterium]